MKTVIIPTRNDNYGMFLAERALQCLNSMTAVFDEVILVDWNSPHDIPLIEQIRDYIEPTGKIRNITVSRKFVTENVPLGAQPCCEVLARNIGIRRAKYDWVVSSNIDIIATPFSTDELNVNTLYTVAKYNVLEEIHLTQLMKISTHDKVLALKANKHLLERMKKCEEVVPSDTYSLVVGCGDFQIGNRSLWNQIRGFEEALIYRCFADSNIMVKAATHPNFRTEILEIDVFHLEHKNNPYFWKKDTVTPRNNYADAFQKYSTTKNMENWGFHGVNFEEIVI